jgi:hypothetical protein
MKRTSFNITVLESYQVVAGDADSQWTMMTSPATEAEKSQSAKNVFVTIQKELADNGN